MIKMFKRFVQEGTFKMSDEEIRQACKEKIGILYGFDSYGYNFGYINKLKGYILKDYPDVKDEDIEVWSISNTESIRHARFTMLRVSIPIEDFIKLRGNGNIYIL